MLTPEDLERVAVLKRCGIDPAGHLDKAAGAAAGSNASGASGSGAAASSRDAAPPASAAAPPRQTGLPQPHLASAAARFKVERPACDVVQAIPGSRCTRPRLDARACRGARVFYQRQSCCQAALDKPDCTFLMFD